MFMNNFSNYPPGESGRATSTIIEVRCPNRDCISNGSIRECAAYFELGSTNLVNDSDAVCPDCNSLCYFEGEEALDRNGKRIYTHDRLVLLNPDEADYLRIELVNDDRSFIFWMDTDAGRKEIEDRQREEAEREMCRAEARADEMRERGPFDID